MCGVHWPESGSRGTESPAAEWVVRNGAADPELCEAVSGLSFARVDFQANRVELGKGSGVLGAKIERQQVAAFEQQREFAAESVGSRLEGDRGQIKPELVEPGGGVDDKADPLAVSEASRGVKVPLQPPRGERVVKQAGRIEPADLGDGRD